MTWREDLRAIIDEVAAVELPDVLGELARAQALVQLRLQPPRQNGTAPAPDRLLTTDEVADRLSMSAKWVYAHGEQLGATHLSTRAVRFSQRAVQRFIASKRGTC